ncbi:MAG: hypothetical protein ACPGPC_08295 [Alphaproteobacteria bacterium]
MPHVAAILVPQSAAVIHALPSVAATHAPPSAAVIPALQSAVATRAAQIHATLVQLEPHPIAASALFLVLPAQTPVLQGAGAILVPLKGAAIPAPRNVAAIHVALVVLR